MQSYAEATTWTDTAGGATLTVGPEWGQGRTTFGGLIAAAALGLLRRDIPADRPLRALSVTFLGPVAPGVCTGEAVVLREGRSMSFGEATITQDGSPRLRLSGAFGAGRPSQAVVDARPAPAHPAPGKGRRFPYIEGVTPAFTRNIEFIWTDGDLPFSGSDRAAFAGYVRHLSAVDDVEAAVLGLIDAWPCSILPTLKGPAPASSVTWSAHLYDLPAQMTDAPWFFEQSVVTASAGYVTCEGRLYRPDGALAAWSEQLVAVFDGSR